MFQGVWVIWAKSPFLHSLDVPMKMFAYSLAVLKQQTLGRTDHVHCLQIPIDYPDTFAVTFSCLFTAICHVIVQKCLSVRQHNKLVVKNCENFCHYVDVSRRLGNLGKISIPT